MPKVKSATVSLAYFVDRKSYPGQEVLYVVSYPTHDHSIGYVFTVFLKKNGSRQIFDVQNNAKFAISGKGIDLVEPPLGGTGTQEDIQAAIRQIRKSPTYAFRASELLAPSPLIGCESYADKQ